MKWWMAVQTIEKYQWDVIADGQSSKAEKGKGGKKKAENTLVFREGFIDYFKLTQRWRVHRQGLQQG